ncbi:hypothetical protein [Actinoplanes sp. NPDC051851]|uniref:hypothetical protein n=1 Tax=Actinoplanes sp. NPDC051851 TaxID=3154753 RepID=UPI00343FBBB6
MKTLHNRLDDLTRIMGNAAGSLTHLACMEADAIAALILAHGDEDTATRVIIDHTAPDEFGEYGCNDDDSPHRHMYPLTERIRVNGVAAQLDELARDYVRAL